MDDDRHREGDQRQGRAGRAEVDELDLHHGRLRRAWFAGADPPAGRHARPDGQAGRLDHRDADHRELPRRPERPAVLHLDPRRPQGPRGYRAEDRELRLPDPSPGRRGAGRGDHRDRLRHARRPDHDPDRRRRRRGRAAARPRAGPHRGRGRVPAGRRRGSDRHPQHAARRSRGCRSSKTPACSRSRCVRRSPANASFGVCALLLRPRPRPRPHWSTTAKRSAWSPRSRSASPARS